MTEIKIRELDDADVQPALAILATEFGPEFTADWFRWKHRSSPFGRSLGWVATDSQGVAGVRLLLPWEFESARGELSAYRPCDTVVHPRARGKGVFTGLMRHAIASLESDVDILFNTPNSQSRGGYFKMGFVVDHELGQRLGVSRRTREGLAKPVAESDSGGSESPRTVRTAEFLRWRYEECPVREYVSIGLESVDEEHGLVCRVSDSSRVRQLLIHELWGSDTVRRRLVRAASAHNGTRVVRVRGSDRDALPFSIVRGSTLVTRFETAGPSGGPLDLSLGDVEDVL